MSWFSKNEPEPQPEPIAETKVQQIQKKVDSINYIMQDNVHEILSRGEKTDHIHQKSDQIKESSKVFHKKAKKARRDTCLPCLSLRRMFRRR